MNTGVRVNAVAPGAIASSGPDTYYAKDTSFIQNEVVTGIPLQRFGTESEVASAIVFLLSSAASFITGSCLRVDGVHRMRGRAGGSCSRCGTTSRTTVFIAPHCRRCWPRYPEPPTSGTVGRSAGATCAVGRWCRGTRQALNLTLSVIL
nr:SDR family oxidoreductase [Nocardia miyunensis]